jgi:hypothetical protein
MRIWQRAIDVSSEIYRAALEVLERDCRLQVVGVEVQTTEHNANIRVEQTAVRDSLEVLWLPKFSVVGGVRAADVWDAFCVEFLFYA